jgi:mRNA interferase HicA
VGRAICPSRACAIGGGNHDKFTNPNREGVLIIVPRHRVVSPGVARDIAKKAGWI